MSDELHSPAPLGRFQRITNTLMAACLGVMAVSVFVNVVLRLDIKSVLRGYGSCKTMCS